ncbi:MAG: ATP-dependent helicase, partial [Acidothermales bacterium]|nr:ATP-dependent helicase [Acidothermales bacterium]
ALADTAPVLLPPPVELDPTDEQRGILDALDGGGALFFRQLGERIRSLDDVALAKALWDLVWAGHVTGDTIAPLRAYVEGRGTHRARPRPPRSRYTTRGLARSMPSRAGPPSTRGRWSLTPVRDVDPTRRAHAVAEVLLDRHGIVTRGAVATERIPGGFAAVYRVLRAFEESGRCRRGYFVEGLGAAQFATPGAVDRLRAESPPGPDTDSSALALAATDPANPYGAALPWPDRPGETAAGHRPGRKSGALVVLVGGRLVLYVERGGRTLLSWPGGGSGHGGEGYDDADVLQPAVDALALAVRDGHLGKLAVERADGEAVRDSPLADALRSAGFHATPKGLRLRA